MGLAVFAEVTVDILAVGGVPLETRVQLYSGIYPVSGDSVTFQLLGSTITGEVGSVFITTIPLLETELTVEVTIDLLSGT
ncbi:MULTISPECIES: hypothetical protein [Alteribacter]|uniref:Uncharacterized protein n=1 Tax=Alteribacter keqinensis TaxID=2483800 RepID=A0A3M7TP23_9BACI|nr:MULTISPECIES: hypothetical protein [Alteribacter]MBM7094964.1 hypothetical protein [Alteribacter salitolerans]RNA66767.1 hypothetical protein EBO34_16270 [Alteribacter keqinensis]